MPRAFLPGAGLCRLRSARAPATSCRGRYDPPCRRSRAQPRRWARFQQPHVVGQGRRSSTSAPSSMGRRPGTGKPRILSESPTTSGRLLPATRGWRGQALAIFSVGNAARPDLARASQTFTTKSGPTRACTLHDPLRLRRIIGARPRQGAQRRAIYRRAGPDRDEFSVASFSAAILILSTRNGALHRITG